MCRQDMASRPDKEMCCGLRLIEKAYTIFHGEEADSFDDCATFWDQVISEEEEGRCPKSDTTLKTAVNHQYYWKTCKKECNMVSTPLLPVHAANTKVRTRDF